MARTKVKKTHRQGWTEGSNRPVRKRRSLVRRVVAGTAKGTARLVVKGGAASARAVRNRGAKQRFPDGYMPEPDEIPSKAWHPSKGGGACDACGKRFGSNSGLRRHFDVQHSGEEPSAKNVARYHGAAVRFERNKKKRAKTVVKTVKRSTGPSKGRTTTAGGRTMGHKEPEIEIEALLLMQRAFEEISMMGTGGLTKMTAFADGLDIVLGRYGTQAFENYRLSLLHKEFPPEVLTGLKRIEELIAEAARESTKWIEHLKDVLEADIKAAKRLRGSGPSVGVLAG